MSDSLLLDETLSDVTLVTRAADGYSWRFPAHTLFLRRFSPRLTEMLEELRAVEGGDQQINLVDLDPTDLLAILSYIYDGHTPTQPSTSLLLTTDRYGPRSLHDLLEQHLLNLQPFPLTLAIANLRHLRQRVADDPISRRCLRVVREHALFVFASDLVLGMEQRDLESVLASDDVNVPDDSVLFWGVWRWGRRRCAMLGRKLIEEEVLGKVDGMLRHIRLSSLKRRDGIPQAALGSFDRCRCRRRLYAPPRDSKEQSSALYVAPRGWRRLEEGRDGAALCLQLSTDRRCFLVALELELCSQEPMDVLVLVIRETDGQEQRRQKVQWDEVILKQLSTGKSDPDSWLEGSCFFTPPLVLSPGTPYSLYLVGAAAARLPSTPTNPRIKKVDGVTVTVHSPDVRVIRNAFLWTQGDMSWS